MDGKIEYELGDKVLCLVDIMGTFKTKYKEAYVYQLDKTDKGGIFLEFTEPIENSINNVLWCDLNNIVKLEIGV